MIQIPKSQILNSQSQLWILLVPRAMLQASKPLDHRAIFAASDGRAELDGRAAARPNRAHFYLAQRYMTSITTYNN